MKENNRQLSLKRINRYSVNYPTLAMLRASSNTKGGLVQFSLEDTPIQIFVTTHIEHVKGSSSYVTCIELW